MQNDATMDRSSKVRVLSCIALVLFCLNLLIFVNRDFGLFQGVGCAMGHVDLRPMETSAYSSSSLYFFKPEYAAAQRYRSKSHRQTTFITRFSARPINEELRIRAAHPSEAYEALRNKLGLTDQTTAHILIMH